MTTMTHSTASFGKSTHHPVVTATLVFLFWIVAAVLIVGLTVSPVSSPGSVAIKLGAIITTAFAYMRLTARRATVDHALFVGLAWLLLAIIAEVAATWVVGRGWFELLGSPASAGVRDITLLTWIAAPVLFARYE